ncbi:hypothetical protein F5B20DRAFT_157453 [Whalleya microplaca]|nr:hypothetical protein F5B20DRAFT_157453 [Whalleya microplaca]
MYIHQLLAYSIVSLAVQFRFTTAEDAGNWTVKLFPVEGCSGQPITFTGSGKSGCRHIDTHNQTSNFPSSVSNSLHPQASMLSPLGPASSS